MTTYVVNLKIVIIRWSIT